MIGIRDVDGSGLTITEPLHVEIVVKHPVTGEPLFRFPPHEDLVVEPGSVVTWEYPADGIRIEMGA